MIILFEFFSHRYYFNLYFYMYEREREKKQKILKAYSLFFNF